MATIFFPPVGFKKFLMTYHNFDYKILKLFLIHEPIDFLILTAYLDFGAVETVAELQLSTGSANPSELRRF